MANNWEGPLYEFTLPSRKIVVNVIRSCPNFDVPAPAVPAVVSQLKTQKTYRVLDFGAVKLRNSLFLLSQRNTFRVYAVEFKECFETPAGKQRLTKAQKHKEFFLLTWPHEFLRADFEVDAVFLVNVCNVVPDEDDRRKIVQECTNRLCSGGWFLWMSQFGEPHYKPGVTKRLKAPDGGWA